MRFFDVLTSYAASGARYPGGMYVRKPGKRPEKPLELYEFEGCPFCRKTREILCALDLDANVYPCPKGGARFRPVAKEKGGKEQFPFLIDPNTGTSMYESMDIARYLASTYGDGTLPWTLSLGPLTTVTSGVASAFRAGHGSRARASRAPEKPLELYGFESSPYCRLAREALCELELPYLLHNVGKRGEKRPAFVARSGELHVAAGAAPRRESHAARLRHATLQVPYLVDPNTGTAMFESADIVAYLNKTYAI